MNLKKTILFVISILLAGCASQSMYKKAVEINTVEKYEEFLQKYPNSKYQSEAKEKIIELEFSIAKSANTIAAFSSFLQKYPNNKYQSEAKEKIIELEFSIAKSANTVAAFSSFLQKYPNSKYQSKAEENIVELEFSITKSTNTISAFTAFLQKYPDNKHKEEAVRQLHELWQSVSRFKPGTTTFSEVRQVLGEPSTTKHISNVREGNSVFPYLKAEYLGLGVDFGLINDILINFEISNNLFEINEITVGTDAQIVYAKYGERGSYGYSISDEYCWIEKSGVAFGFARDKSDLSHCDIKNDVKRIIIFQKGYYFQYRH